MCLKFLLFSVWIETTIVMAAACSIPKHVVVIGGGIQGTSVAYYLIQQAPPTTKVTILEAKAMASAASGKGGGFMARSWGDGSPTQRLHEVAFDLYETLARDLQCTSYRKLPVLSVAPGTRGGDVTAVGAVKRNNPQLQTVIPNWLDGNVGRISSLGMGDDTAQITPSELVEKMLQAISDRVTVLVGTCTDIQTQLESEQSDQLRVVGVKYQPPPAVAGAQSSSDNKECVLPADAVVVSAGPWSCAAEDWFMGAVQLPMEGVKSTSIVWKPPVEGTPVDATALFCGEDHRYGTHCKSSGFHESM